MLERANDRVVAAVLALGILVFGVATAGRHPFWLDEAFTAQAARRGFASLIRFLGHEAGMGPYYLVLWVWRDGGTSETWLRTLSVVGGAFAVAAVFLFARHIIGRPMAVAAAVALWCNPFFVYNLTELRAYSWTMWFGVATVATCVRFRNEPTTRRAVAWGGCVGLMLSALAFTAPLVATQAAWLWPRRRDRRLLRGATIAAVAAAVLFAPFVPALLRSNQIDWIQPLTASRFVRHTAEALGGYRWMAVLGLGNVLLLAALLRPTSCTDDDSTLRLLLAGVAAMPVGLAALEVVQPVFIPRYLSAMLPLAIVGAAAGFCRTADFLRARWQRRAGAAALALLLALAAFTAVTYDVLRPEDMRAPARFIAAHLRPGDAVLFDADQVRQAAEYYITPPPSAPNACRRWYYFRGDRAQLLASLGRAADDPGVVTTPFRGYVVGEVDTCGG